MHENNQFSTNDVSFNEEEAPLELGIQMLETMDAPFWATGIGVVITASLVASVAYT